MWEEGQVFLEECKRQHWESQSPGGTGERCNKKIREKVDMLLRGQDIP